MSGITSCTNCGLPIFHGAAGYAGAQCRCGFSAKPNCGHNALADLLKERDQLKADMKLTSEMLVEVSRKGMELRLERDTLRKQLDEVRGLLTGCQSFRDAEINAWLGATKP